MNKMGIAIVGCGNIASFYFATLHRHPQLQLVGINDRDPKRAEIYSRYYAVPTYHSFAELLDDDRVELVINLTNPSSHYAVSKASLEAGKHVYSEKPLAMRFVEASELVALAAQRGLRIASAPSRVLAETAQTMWRAIAEGVVGKPRAVYAEMDGGMLYRSDYRSWLNELGMPWPYQDEFEVGCTVEHAGYSISWLTAFFGPVERVGAFASVQIPEIAAQARIANTLPPDLTVACLTFRSGLVARLTSSWIAPHDHSIRIFGDDGVLSTEDIWAPKSPVVVTRNRTLCIGQKKIAIPRRTRLSFAEPPPVARVRRPSAWSFKTVARALRSRFLHLRKRVDFCLGPAELAASIREGRGCRLPADYCLHNTEVLLAINEARSLYGPHVVSTSFEPLTPLSWAQPRIGSQG